MIINGLVHLINSPQTPSQLGGQWLAQVTLGGGNHSRGVSIHTLPGDKVDTNCLLVILNFLLEIFRKNSGSQDTSPIKTRLVETEVVPAKEFHREDSLSVTPDDNGQSRLGFVWSYHQLGGRNKPTSGGVKFYLTVVEALLEIETQAIELAQIAQRGRWVGGDNNVTFVGLFVRLFFAGRLHRGDFELAGKSMGKFTADRGRIKNTAL